MNNPIKWEDVNTSNYFKMGNRHVKTFSSLIKEMKRLPIRIAKIKTPRSNRYWRGCGERRTLLHCWWECKPGQPLWNRGWKFLRKLKIELPYDPSMALLGLY